MARLPNSVCIPCGPECRHASRLARAAGEWVWCSLRAEPRLSGGGALECPYFAPSSELAGSSPFAAVLYSGRSATDQLPHEN